METSYICPECKQTLTKGNTCPFHARSGLFTTAFEKEYLKTGEISCLTCPDCSKTYPVIAGVPVFADLDNFYGELPRDVMQGLLLDLEENRWEDILYRYVYESNPFAYNYITATNRADWQFLLDFEPGSRVLDIGSGWGTISFPLSLRFQVTSLEPVLERAIFLEKRRCQEKNESITSVCANILTPPFPEKSFDLVVMNGVLEWVGASDHSDTPRKLQEKALKISKDLLKPGGKLYIGIENRTGLKYLMGSPDDHTGVRDVCYRPEKERNDIYKRETGKEYRTNVYNRDEYSEMLSEAGFGDVEFLYAHPDYKLPEYFMTMDRNVIDFMHTHLRSGQDLKKGNDRTELLECYINREAEIANFVPSYGIIAKV